MLMYQYILNIESLTQSQYICLEYIDSSTYFVEGWGGGRRCGFWEMFRAAAAAAAAASLGAAVVAAAAIC